MNIQEAVKEMEKGKQVRIKHDRMDEQLAFYYLDFIGRVTWYFDKGKGYGERTMGIAMPEDILSEDWVVVEPQVEWIADEQKEWFCTSCNHLKESGHTSDCKVFSKVKI